MAKDKEKTSLDSQKEFQALIGLGEGSLRKSYYSELQKKVDELAEEKLKFERIVTGALNGIFQAEIDGKIFEINQAMISLCGFVDREEFLANTPNFHQVFADAGSYQSLIQKLKKKRRVKQYETKFKTKEGHTVDVSLNASLNTTLGDENSLYIEGFVEDITEKLKIQNQLAQTRKMDALGKISGGIAHDFNNMLGGIIGAAELLKEEIASMDQPYLDLILQSAQSAADLTKKLLMFSRSESEFKTVVDMHKVIKDVIALLSRSLDKRVQIIAHIEPSTQKVSGDYSQLQNAILNLCINSSHAMEDEGTITITSEINHTNHPPENATTIIPYLNGTPFIRISILDTGCGIKTENLEKVFDPFFTTKERGKGTGLGLSSVYGIVKAHKGAIHVHSKIDEGTCIFIDLPVCVEEASSEMTIKQVPKGEGFILLADDEPVLLQTTADSLKKLGYNVRCESNGKDALSYFQQHADTIDLVIIDMIMPKMNGHDAVLKMQKIAPNLKVIVVTGYYKEEDMEQLQNAGFSNILRKPFRKVELAEMVNHVLTP